MAVRWRMVIATDAGYKRVSSGILMCVGRGVLVVRHRVPLVAAKVAVRKVLS